MEMRVLILTLKDCSLKGSLGNKIWFSYDFTDHPLDPLYGKAEVKSLPVDTHTFSDHSIQHTHMFKSSLTAGSQLSRDLTCNLTQWPIPLLFN